MSSVTVVQKPNLYMSLPPERAVSSQQDQKSDWGTYAVDQYKAQSSKKSVTRTAIAGVAGAAVPAAVFGLLAATSNPNTNPPAGEIINAFMTFPAALGGAAGGMLARKSDSLSGSIKWGAVGGAASSAALFGGLSLVATRDLGFSAQMAVYAAPLGAISGAIGGAVEHFLLDR